MKKNYMLIFLLILFIENAYPQVVEVVCYGTTKAYSVDTDDGLNGTVGSSYSWQIKNSDGTINMTSIINAITSSGNSISIN